MANARGDLVTVQPIVFHRVMEAVAAAEWQVVQTADGLDVLIAGARDGFSAAALVGGLQRELGTHGVAPLPIQVVQVAAIPRSAIGKAPLIRANRASLILLRKRATLCTGRSPLYTSAATSNNHTDQSRPLRRPAAEHRRPAPQCG
ncbi:MAG: hypothetical protein M3010_12105 [Candidatus Dormibacteraeota bacterium]|nr:hypothetical protein [Candidatus Dormibacteraeota bacterium]